MTGKLLAPLRESPAALPLAAALALLIAWSADQGGYPVSHWAPGGIVMLALLGIAIFALGAGGSPPSPPARLARGALFAYAGWSYLSMLWAGAPASALEGGDRALLYALIFTLFCSWPLSARVAAGLLCIWILALAGLAVAVLAHLDQLGASGLLRAMPGGRLVYPAGYVNAAAAQWMLAAFPAALLARSARLHVLLRGLMAASAVLLCDVALLSLSRGSLIATGVMLVVVLLAVPGRLRGIYTLVPIAAGVAFSVPALLDVGRRIEQGMPAAAHSSLAEAIIRSLLAAAVAGCVLAICAVLVDRRRRPPGRAPAAAHRLLMAFTGLMALAAVLAGIKVIGNPIARIEHAWSTFSSTQGYAADSRTGNRLTRGLGSNRYDFYRVALDEFAGHPLLGIGSENFEAQYLLHGRSSETPRYPHSLELRTLAETGLIGSLILLLGLLGAAVAGARAMLSRRGRGDQLAGSVAAAALAGFGYWLVHGSADWLWEYAGLGAPAFALLGLACGLDRRSRRERPVALRGPAADAESPDRPGAGARSAERPSGAEGTIARAGRQHLRPNSIGRLRRAPRSGKRVVAALAGLASLGAALAFASPWLSVAEMQSAATSWRQDKHVAYLRLRSAAALDPWSAQPYLLAGGIALRAGELRRADREFGRALQRSPGEQYATLERGAIASQLGEAARARQMLERSLALYPRDALAHQALAIVRAGGRVDVSAMNRAILSSARGFQ